jgi:hypothetical protein
VIRSFPIHADLGGDVENGVANPASRDGIGGYRRQKLLTQSSLASGVLGRLELLREPLAVEVGEFREVRLSGDGSSHKCL